MYRDMLLISHLISDRRVARIKKEKGVDQLGGRQKKTEVDETRDRHREVNLLIPVNSIHLY